jgi:hypothetical protein
MASVLPRISETCAHLTAEQRQFLAALVAADQRQRKPGKLPRNIWFGVDQVLRDATGAASTEKGSRAAWQLAYDLWGLGLAVMRSEGTDFDAPPEMWVTALLAGFVCIEGVETAHLLPDKPKPLAETSP